MLQLMMSRRCANHFAWGLLSRRVLSCMEHFICVNEAAVITALKVLFSKKKPPVALYTKQPIYAA